MERSARWEFVRRVTAWAFRPEADPQLTRTVEEFLDRVKTYTPPAPEQIRACEVLGLARPKTMAEAEKMLRERRAS